MSLCRAQKVGRKQQSWVPQCPVSTCPVTLTRVTVPLSWKKSLMPYNQAFITNLKHLSQRRRS